MRLTSGWWTYELCWPWNLRQYHHTLEGEVEGRSFLLADFQTSQSSTAGLSLSRAPPRQEGQRYELVANAEGGTCENLVQKWRVSIPGGDDLAGGGSSFNPPGVRRVEGLLARQPDENIHGCKMFEERVDDKVVLLKRGKCWFHTKAINAQAAGAKALIVFNDQVQMVDVMEGVDELPSPMILTVLVEQERGTRLLEHLGTTVTIEKAAYEGVETQRPIASTVLFRCSSDFHGRHRACQVGDEVDVKVPPPEGAIPGSKWPLTQVRIVRAKVEEIDDSKNTFKATWLAPPEGEVQAQDADLSDLPSSVPLRWAYYEGNPCESRSGGRIELISEPQACNIELLVHVPELCSHPRLAAPQPKEPQVISCSAHESTRAALAKHREAPAKPESASDVEQVVSSD